MPGVVVYKGQVLGVNSREYSFADRNTGEKVEGVAHRVFIYTDDESEPVMELRVNDELAVKCQQARGKTVEVGAEPRARDSRVVWHATHVKQIG